jgi:adenine-specific DNA-methyltransferase
MKVAPTDRKLRGGYYTPRPIAEFLSKWSIPDRHAQILEPSCGDGVFLEAAARCLSLKGATPVEIADSLHGVELEPAEASKAIAQFASRGLPHPHVEIGDFFAYCKATLPVRRFDAVIGNPPFIRYQNFLEEHRICAFDLMAQAGLRPNRLTNAWTPFVVASTLLLREGGRLAMVVPAELLQVGYAAELRRFMSINYRRITLFTFKHLVFDSIQQEVVLFCGERGASDREDAWIRTVELNGLSDLLAHEHTDFEQAELKTMDHSSEKWTQYFLSKSELQLLRMLREDRRIARLGDVASVDVGIVTGMNEFFVLTKQQTRKLQLSGYVESLVTRSGHLKGVVFTRADWATNVAAGAPAFLLNLAAKPRARLARAARSYVKYGERKKFHTGYKCRIRGTWYAVPSVWSPDAFLLRQIHSYPKLILNRADASCTDTIHRVRFKKRWNGPRVVSAFLNSLTFAFSEVIGRSYGGGVLELEPNEADALPMPLVGAEALDVERADALLRSPQSIDKLLDAHDRVLLTKGLGLSESDVSLLRGIWMKLRNRRIGRKAR